MVQHCGNMETKAAYPPPHPTPGNTFLAALTRRHQHERREQGDLVLRQVHRTQVLPEFKDGADQVVATCQRERRGGGEEV